MERDEENKEGGCSLIEGETRNRKNVMMWAYVTVFSSILYYDIFPGLFNDWMNDENYSHGILVPLIIAYIYWMRKEKLDSFQYDPSPWGLGCFVAGLLIFLVGRFGSEYYATRMSFLLLASGSSLALVGWHFFKYLLPGLSLFSIAIPLPYLIYNSVALPLRLFASAMSSHILLAIGIPVFNEGNIIQLPGLTLSIDDACSGLRSLMSYLTIAAVAIVLSPLTKGRKAVFLVSTVAVAMLVNIFRIVGTGTMTYLFDKSLAEGFFHLFSGWVIFIFGLSILLGIYILLDRRPR